MAAVSMVVAVAPSVVDADVVDVVVEVDDVSSGAGVPLSVRNPAYEPRAPSGNATRISKSTKNTNTSRFR
jgi:hypothetical protein